MLAYALVLIAVFFMAGVAAVFTVLHWVVRTRTRRAAREAGAPLATPAAGRISATAPARPAVSPAPMSPEPVSPVPLSPAPALSAPVEVPAQRRRPDWPGPSVRAAFARTPRPAARRT